MTPYAEDLHVLDTISESLARLKGDRKYRSNPSLREQVKFVMDQNDRLRRAVAAQAKEAGEPRV